MNNTPFSPLAFLASLGAGGIAVTPFAFLQYTTHTGPGLIKSTDIARDSLSFSGTLLQYGLEAIMIVFTILHLVLSVYFAKKLVEWFRSGAHTGFLKNPLVNAGILAPFISLVMTMNVGIGPVRYLFPSMAENLQAFMLPALILWLVIWVVLMITDMKLLKTSFEEGFDTAKISFGWLLHPFALGMLTVTGTGIAAMAHDVSIANIAAFFSLVSGSMGLFLLLVKLIVIFKSHFAAPGLPEKHFLPSFLIVVPNVTLYAIAGFRFMHYLEHVHGFETALLAWLIVLSGFAFEVWYMLFGLTLLREFFTEHFTKKEFYLPLWGLVCPVVAFAVLGSFAYKLFLTTPIIYGILVATILIAVALFFFLLSRHITCSRKKEGKIACS